MNVTELRRFLGMVNQLGKFTPRLAELTHPLRELLGKRNLWRWESSQKVAFSQIKEELSKLATLLPYNMEAETKVSWSLSETEKRYAQVEKEALAIITWAYERFSTYLLGTQFLIETVSNDCITTERHKGLIKFAKLLLSIARRGGLENLNWTWKCNNIMSIKPTSQLVMGYFCIMLV